MTERFITTAAQEAIRIAETYLPKASRKRKAALAREIVDVTSLCEAEIIDEVGRGLEDLLQQ